MVIHYKLCLALVPAASFQLFLQLLTCSCQYEAPVLLPFSLTIYFYFRELIHLLIHLSEALHEAQLKLILVIPPAVAAG